MITAETPKIERRQTAIELATPCAPLDLSSRITPQASDEPNHEPSDDTLYLIGRPTLKQFLRFAKNNALKPANEGTLVEQWKEANKVLKTLEKNEAGIADNPAITKLEVTPSNEGLLTEFLKDPLVQNSFNTVPTEIAFVELDRLVVFQHHIDLTYVRKLERALGDSPTEEQIFRTALLHDHPWPPVRSSRVHRNTFVFMSPSNDLRFLGSMKLKSSNIKDYAVRGNLEGVVGIAVGFGSNFLNAIYSGNRLILNNGSHRAYAFRKMGITRVPCIIQHVSSRDELDVVASSKVIDNYDYYLKDPRPSLLKDYFDPRLHTVVPTRRQCKQITVKFEIDDAYIPAF